VLSFLEPIGLNDSVLKMENQNMIKEKKSAIINSKIHHAPSKTQIEK
jgi:hypothetical protein